MHTGAVGQSVLGDRIWSIFSKILNHSNYCLTLARCPVKLELAFKMISYLHGQRTNQMVTD